MDIKKRIDGLTEIQAKAVIEWFFDNIKYVSLRCKLCPASGYCPSIFLMGGEKCKNLILDEALKEARDERI